MRTFTETPIITTPEHLLEQDFSRLSKNKASSVLRGLLAYEMRAAPGSEHVILHGYYAKLQSARLQVARHFTSLGGEVASVVLADVLPEWPASERPPIAELVKTHGYGLYGA
jgi:hypothetical protein